MKKISVLLLMVSVVAGMTLPAMATDTASGEVNNAPQENNIQDVLVASGDNTNSATATIDVDANAKDAKSGDATSGDAYSDDATSGNANVKDVNVKSCCEKPGPGLDSPVGLGGSKTIIKAETGDAKSIAKTGNAYSGDAKNIAVVKEISNSASANHNNQVTGNVDNDIKQTNVQKTTTPDHKKKK